MIPDQKSGVSWAIRAPAPVEAAKNRGRPSTDPGGPTSGSGVAVPVLSGELSELFGDNSRDRGPISFARAARTTCDLEVCGDLAYLVTDDRYVSDESVTPELVIVDLSDPAHPVRLGAVESP